SSSVEMAGKGGLGLELDLDRVPTREQNMTAYEIMLSESQERMLMILKPEREALARKVFEKWELDFAIIGRVTETGRLVLKKDGKVAADMPVGPLVTEAPLYERPWVPAPALPELAAKDVKAVEPIAALKKLIGCPDLASKRWIWEQYDHLVMGHTVQRPGGDAAVVRIPGRKKALALSTDCTPRYVAADPKRGGAQAVAESWRNLTSVGALPLAITDNMNFGNPERPEIMGQFALCIEGMREACLALDYPVVSGNVSLYNETNGSGILPTPAIGGVGLIEDAAKSVSLGFKRAGETIVLIGATKGHLGQSLYLRELLGREEGAPPPVDLAAEKRNGDFVRAQILGGKVSACHDLSDGGFLVALAEMAISSGIGAALAFPASLPAHAFLFGEDQARYLLATSAPDSLLEAAAKADVPASIVGKTGGDALTLSGGNAISVAELRRINEAWLPAYMAAAV
ncbi:MAG TPA: AIR synthase-related protein, partial [Stellaceae bacterium]|nr:AIR synthase-related protein [Stellaceae bacterium]